MNPKNFRIFLKGFTLCLTLAFVMGSFGCDDNQNRIGKRGSSGRIALDNGLDLATEVSRTAYVLSKAQSSDINVGQIFEPSFNRKTSQTNRQSTAQINQGRAIPNVGTFGLVTLYTVRDSTDLTTSRLQGRAAQVNAEIINYSAGLSVYNSGRLQIVDEVTEKSYMDILPNRTSLIVTHPNLDQITQLLLDQNGAIRYVLPIPVGAKPTRFATMHDFANQPYLFVATDQGIVIVKFESHTVTDLPYPFGVTGRVIGTIQESTSKQSTMPGSPSIKVFDIAISPDDKVIYAINKDNYVYMKDMNLFLEQGYIGQEDYLGYQPLRIVTPPQNITSVPLNSIVALNSNGIEFYDGTPNFLLGDEAWGRLGQFGPKDVDFHPDGNSILILTSSKLFRATLNRPESGKRIPYLKINSGARAMKVDKRKGKFLMLINRSEVAAYPLDEYGIVSPNGPDSVARVPGDPYSVTIN